MELVFMVHNIRREDKSSLELLGAPIFEEGVHNMFSAKLERVEMLSKRLQLLDVHLALCIFKSSLSAPRFNYLLRECKSFLVLEVLDKVDDISSILRNLSSEYSLLDDKTKSVQKKWDLIGVQKVFDELLISGSPVDSASLLASSTKESLKWLQVIPSSKLGFVLDNNAARKESQWHVA